MPGRFATGTVLVLLAAAAAICAAVETINLTQMEWLKDQDSVTLTVCAETDLQSDNVTLLLGQTGVGSRDYPAASVQGACANFTDSPAQPVPEEELAYQLIVVNSTTDEYLQRGSVQFTFSMYATTVRCSYSDYVRLNIPTGSFSNESCLPEQADPLVCYTTVEDPRVCVQGLDASNAEFQVCVTQTPADSTDNPGFLNVSSLNYDGGSVSINPDGPTDLLARNQETGYESVSACQDTCSIAGFAPSAESYDLCGVFVDNDSAITSASTTFQDLNLVIDSTAPYIDFYMVNKYSEMKYKVYMGADAALVLTGSSVGLDCTRVPINSTCYGFVSAESQPTYLAVEYDDGTNAVISSTGISTEGPLY